MTDKQKIAINNAIMDLAESKDKTLTCIIDLGQYGNERWAVVIAWQDGYEPCDDEYADGEYRIVGKVAYQPTNSLMQEYDIDWLMPYDDETGEVDDTEVTVDDIDFCIYWWEEEWKRIQKECDLDKRR